VAIISELVMNRCCWVVRMGLRATLSRRGFTTPDQMRAQKVVGWHASSEHSGDADELQMATELATLGVSGAQYFD